MKQSSARSRQELHEGDGDVVLGTRVPGVPIGTFKILLRTVLAAKIATVEASAKDAKHFTTKSQASRV
eukprot:812830-Pelagomonas_calceolata.AAC.5